MFELRCRIWMIDQVHTLYVYLERGRNTCMVYHQVYLFIDYTKVPTCTAVREIKTACTIHVHTTQYML